MSAPEKPQARGKKDPRVAPARDASSAEDPERVPEEWDFRQVTKSQLEEAIYYEYARSCDWVLEVFKQWHEKRFPASKSAHLSKWSGWTISKLLERPGDAEEPPKEVLKWYSDVMPDEFGTHGLHIILDICQLFPRPFLRVASQVTAQLRRPKYQERLACWLETGHWDRLRVRLFNSLRGLGDASVADEDVGGNENAEEKATSLRRIVVDLQFPKPKIKNDLSRLVDELHDSKFEKFKPEIGKAAAPPWHRLKELAAYRLVTQFGVPKGKLRPFVQAWKQKTTVVDEFFVLPDYGPGGCNDAINSARQYIETLFPKL